MASSDIGVQLTGLVKNKLISGDEDITFGWTMNG
jgi:hypothetical protein